MGEAESNTLQPDFNRSVKVEFDDQRITANAGVLLLREIDHRIGLTESIAKVMHDPRQQNLIRYKLSELIREHVVRRAGRPPREGYEYWVELGMYQADSWRHSQRLILVVVDRPDPQTGQLDLIPRYFFLVTNWLKSERSAEEV